jgi:predicted nucleic acid-binding protein
VYGQGEDEHRNRRLLRPGDHDRCGILADTSAWAEFDRATGSPVHLRLAELIDTSGPLAVTEPVVMEVLAGARDERREADLRRLLLRFELLSFDAVADFDGAVRIYRRCRAGGGHSTRDAQLHDRGRRMAPGGRAPPPPR